MRSRRRRRGSGSGSGWDPCQVLGGARWSQQRQRVSGGT